MCGIIGYTGSDKAEQILIDGLHALEYRGYDSAGISVSSFDGIRTVKCKGKVDALKAKLSDENLPGRCGIGHTRWATHGEPSENNAHPHNSAFLSLVHNGIIENYGSLKKDLSSLGYTFKSETDTECLAHLLNECYLECGKDPVKAICRSFTLLKGSYAIGVIFSDRPNEIYAARKDNPLIVAKGEHGCFIASDIPALLPHTKKMCRVGENEVVRLTADSLEFFDSNGAPIVRALEESIWNFTQTGKNGFDHYMLKEIYEQPDAIVRAVSQRLDSHMLPDFSSDNISDSLFADIDSVSIIGCGSAVHAGLVGKVMIESMAKVPVSVHIASEYRYMPPVPYGKTLTVCISQSGETADTLAALRCAKSQGSPTLGIVNAVGSSIAEECDSVLYTNAGPEIAVATTKGYTTQVAVLSVLAAKLAKTRKTVSDKDLANFCHSLLAEVPNAVSRVLSEMDKIGSIAEMIMSHDDVFFIGRGVDNCVAPECSLKLKEISYIHCEAYAAGELKHGTLSLVTEGVPVFALACDTSLFEKTLSNIREVRSRGGNVILVCDESLENAEDYADTVFKLPHVSRFLSPFVSVAFGQCLSYKTTLLRGYDVDRPRNLAKSVTVE